jgi:uncharacterized protein YfaS (alpha-2-macroglobulin family)
MSLKFRIALFFASSSLLLPAAAQAARDEMRFTDVYVEAETDSPRACFEFTRKLNTRGAVHYEDYVRFEPEFPAEFTARGRRLCVSGMNYGEVYSATLLKGLPDSGDRTTEKTEQFNVSIPDRSPSLKFSGASYILPSRGERALPLTSVNVSEADVKILRINDRNLINEINAGRISSLMARWDATRIASLSGETVWEGVIEMEMEKNRGVKTSIPVGDILGQPEPGIYIVMAIPRAERQGYVYYEATQWMVVTDIGMTSISGRDGLHVFLRSLQDAKFLAGTKVQLIARNNEVLGTAITDRQGKASFAPGLVRGKGGAQPGAVMAFGDSGEFNFLDLTKPAFDLTDRGVGGRAGPGPIDGFIYTDRGVYRPGETVNLVALLRGDRAMALEGTPLKLRILKPDGTEHNVVDVSENEKGGGYHFALPLSKSANTGSWTVQAQVDPKGPSVGAGTFQVEDFVPERMEVELSADAPYVGPGKDYEVAVDAQFLYGAPGAGLAVEGEMVLMQDNNPWPEMKGYKFGLVQEEWRPRREALEPVKTDGNGLATMQFRFDEEPDTTRPLKARLRVSVEENGGRAVSRILDLPVRARDRTIGIKPRFTSEWLEKGTEAGFDVVVMDREGKQVAAKGLKYELFYEDHWYHWYTDDGNWRYRVTIDANSIDSGDLDIAAGTPAKLGFSHKWGQYRLEVSDPVTGAATSVRFRFGWFSSSASSEVPDKLRLSLDKDKYRVGETARVHIKPPFAGEMLLTVAGGKVYETRNISVPAEGLVVELPVMEEWDAGAYVTATLFRTAETDKPHQPARAIGLAWLGRDYTDRTLDIEIEAPERIVPRQTIDVELSVNGIAPGEKAHVTLAAVDVGILQLTSFKSPAPADWYFGKRRLGVALRDGYGNLIAAAEGGPATIRQGGDEAAAGRHLGGLDASSVKTVSLFSGVVEVGEGGRVTVPLEVPDFNGRLRLMAVAWSKSAVGSADTDMTVRDPVVSQVTLPRFLAPGDEARVTVSVHNVDGPVGKYNVTFEAAGAVGMDGVGKPFQMARDAKRDLTWSLTGVGVGVGALALTIEGPDGFKLERDWEIAVRPAQAVASRQISSRIQAGQKSTLTGSIMDEFIPGSGEAMVTLSSRPEMGLAKLLKSLSRYPYGCAEQTTSRALPLLYVSEIAESLGIAENSVLLRGRVQDAIRRLFSMQRSDGSFGLWNAHSDREEWLSAYVMDFLTQAKELKYPVPEYPYQRGLKWLQTSVGDPSYSRANLPARTYALYVLARTGQVRKSDLRYLFDTQLQSIPTALGRAQLGAALALSGDERRASAAFVSATRTWDRGDRFWKDWWHWDYGTGTRDMAATVYLATLSKVEEGDWPDYAQKLADRVGKERYLSTQEKAWLILAAHELGTAESVKVAVRGKTLPESVRPVYARFDEDEMRDGVAIANLGDKPIWQSITYSGVPRDKMPAEDEGFAVFRAFYTLDGKKANLDKVRQGDTLVAVIHGESTSKRDQQAMVVDLLPAGFELENERLEGGRDREELRWLGKLTPATHEELRDDRYVAAFGMDRWGDQTFKFAYLVRAVSPGKFTLPAVYVEDMYQPTYFARTRMSRVTILPAE